MLRTDVAVAELARLVDRKLDHLLGARRQGDLAWRRRLFAAADHDLDRGARLGEIDPQRIKYPRSYPFAFADESQQEMLDAYVVMVETDRLVLRQGEDALRAVIEAVEGSHV